MSRLVREGFECRTIGLAFDTPSGSVSISTSNPQTGSCALYTGLSTGNYTRKTLSDVYAETFHSFSWYVNTAVSGILYHWVAAGGATCLGQIRFNATSGHLEAYVGTTLVATGSAVLSVGVRYHIQIRVKVADADADPAVTGRIQVAVDNDPAVSLDIDYSGDTKPGADTGLQILGFGAWGGSGNTPQYYDDWAVNDTAGGADDSWPGDVRLIPFYPNNNGTTSGLTGSDGNQANNYQQVDDLATVVNDGDTTYNKATAEGQYDTYVCSDPTIPAGAVFKSVIVEDISRKTNGGIATQARAALRTNATDYVGTAHDLGISYAKYQTEWLTDPSGGGWDATKINALEIGLEGRGAFA